MPCFLMPFGVWDHPRIRGEHLVSGEPDGVGRGSSPHTRGAQGCLLVSGGGEGIIPAYAGSTTPSWKVTGNPADHPRIRGEHALPVTAGRNTPGSSPHTRGAPAGLLVGEPGQGIIPAYAGSTVAGSASRPVTAGSSPHTRGARPIRDRAPRVRRIIPAYAGSTFRRLAALARVRDHPRIRGEHRLSRTVANSTPGSSPHTRGAPTGWTGRPG